MGSLNGHFLEKATFQEGWERGLLKFHVSIACRKERKGQVIISFKISVSDNICWQFAFKVQPLNQIYIIKPNCSSKLKLRNNGFLPTQKMSCTYTPKREPQARSAIKLWERRLWRNTACHTQEYFFVYGVDRERQT